MAGAEFDWESLLGSDAPPGYELRAALFTTYDRADERLVVEHLLPVLLKLDHEPDGEGLERQSFLVELDRRLKRLHDRLVVVSSTTREESSDAEEADVGAYGWIWRSIRHLSVGRKGRAVQHAKLWFLHWRFEGGPDYLEIVVSSANLTRAAFKGQLQSAWRACLKLHDQGSAARASRWGVLPGFLQELAAAAGDDTRLKTFVDLLGRADRPDGIAFIASVPGIHSRQLLRRTPWGAAGLRQIAPPGRGAMNVSILCPFVGWWDVLALQRWCRWFDGDPDRINLVWIDQNHPWAIQRRWFLTNATRDALLQSGANLLQLRYSSADRDLFHEKHRPADIDERWSHAKLYAFRRGTSRRLLVTSANFSAAAWGSENSDGGLTIENFELGVCIEKATWPLFDTLEAFEDPARAATVAELSDRGTALITWARAEWDGKIVAIDCRCEAGHALTGAIKSKSGWAQIALPLIGEASTVRSARVPWIDPDQHPDLVELRCEYEVMSVPVFDARPSREREKSAPPDLDEDIVQSLRDGMLFELYGGRIAAEAADDDAVVVDGPGDGEGDPEQPRADSYVLPAFEIARQHFAVVDTWAGRVRSVSNNLNSVFERSLLRRDGESLIDAFHRQAERERQAARDDSARPTAGMGARLAAEELALRLKHVLEA